MSEALSPKLSFSEGAAQLSALCNIIEAQEEMLDDFLSAEFHDALANTVAAVDRRKALMRELKSKREMAKAYIEEIKTYVRKLDRISEGVKRTTKEVITAHPDISFTDSLGKALSVVKNQPKVVVDEDAAAYFKDWHFMYEKSTVHVDLEKVKTHLLAGNSLPWARLEYGTQLRGLT